ncbi:MAG: MotA/TolQ/ExbB proton channel family protein [Gammaproteobacteria bacterium]|jgi:biopolymer transport protein ExbB/TolQ|nr:MotA/TolQ/ExbB proton channel family protein [Gammaproteobacteria bacterium]MDG2338561.1 MotA/TolQ/ExbB proton channel family protein [Gammaproteobacteria bacterium]
MKQRLLSEALYQVAALIIAVIVVHAAYVAVIRPNADLLQEQQNVLQQTDPNFVPERSVYIIMRDFEQETCIILLLWALSIIGMKTQQTLKERGLLEWTLINVSDGASILPEDARNYARPVQALPDSERQFLLPRALLAGLHRFQSTQNIQDVATTIKVTCDTEADRMETELTIVRYIAWAIPSIGFLGTVRGIGTALGQAYQAVSGDIVGVTVSLGVAFNSTFVALVVSILLMFVLHQLQLIQDRLVLDCQTYCDERMLRHLQVPQKDS